MKKRSTAFLGLSAVLLSSLGMVTISSTGDWPENWPEELEPLRKQAQTYGVAHGIQENEYVIPFKSAKEFEKAWPNLLKVKSDGAPIVLVNSPHTYNVGGAEIAAGVIVLCPSGGYSGNADDELLEKVGFERLVKEGKLLHAEAPWPKSAYEENGVLAEYVSSSKEDGAMTWRPWKESDMGFKHRARVDIVLAVDGKIVDLNRIKLPPNTPIVDRRFEEDIEG